MSSNNQQHSTIDNTFTTGAEMSTQGFEDTNPPSTISNQPTYLASQINMDSYDDQIHYYTDNNPSNLITYHASNIQTDAPQVTSAGIPSHSTGHYSSNTQAPNTYVYPLHQDIGMQDDLHHNINHSSSSSQQIWDAMFATTQFNPHNHHHTGSAYHNHQGHFPQGLDTSDIEFNATYNHNLVPHLHQNNHYHHHPQGSNFDFPNTHIGSTQYLPQVNQSFTTSSVELQPSNYQEEVASLAIGHNNNLQAFDTNSNDFDPQSNQSQPQPPRPRYHPEIEMFDDLSREFDPSDFEHNFFTSNPDSPPSLAQQGIPNQNTYLQGHPTSTTSFNLEYTPQQQFYPNNLDYNINSNLTPTTFTPHYNHTTFHPNHQQPQPSSTTTQEAHLSNIMTTFDMQSSLGMAPLADLNFGDNNDNVINNNNNNNINNNNDNNHINNRNNIDDHGATIHDGEMDWHANAFAELDGDEEQVMRQDDIVEQRNFDVRRRSGYGTGNGVGDSNVTYDRTRDGNRNVIRNGNDDRIYGSTRRGNGNGNGNGIGNVNNWKGNGNRALGSTGSGNGNGNGNDNGNGDGDFLDNTGMGTRFISSGENDHDNSIDNNNNNDLPPTRQNRLFNHQRLHRNNHQRYPHQSNPRRADNTNIAHLSSQGTSGAGEMAIQARNAENDESFLFVEGILGDDVIANLTTRRVMRPTVHYRAARRTAHPVGRHRGLLQSAATQGPQGNNAAIRPPNNQEAAHSDSGINIFQQNAADGNRLGAQTRKRGRKTTAQETEVPSRKKSKRTNMPIDEDDIGDLDGRIMPAGSEPSNFQPNLSRGIPENRSTAPVHKRRTKKAKGADPKKTVSTIQWYQGTQETASLESLQRSRNRLEEHVGAFNLPPPLSTVSSNDEIYQLLCRLPFLQGLTSTLLQDSGLLDAHRGLSLIAHGNTFPSYIRDLAAEILLRWQRQFLSPNLWHALAMQLTLNRGAKVERRNVSWIPDPIVWDHVVQSSSYRGQGNLVNGQWWPSLMAAQRDGAHGNSFQGIHGQKDDAAYSIVFSGAKAYAGDQDHGDTIEVSFV